MGNHHLQVEGNEKWFWDSGCIMGLKLTIATFGQSQSADGAGFSILREHTQLGVVCSSPLALVLLAFLRGGASLPIVALK